MTPREAIALAPVALERPSALDRLFAWREPPTEVPDDTVLRSLGFLHEPIRVWPAPQEEVTITYVRRSGFDLRDHISIPETLGERVVLMVALIALAMMIGISIGVCIQAGGAWL